MSVLAQSPKTYISINGSDHVEYIGQKFKLKQGDQVEFLLHANPFLYDIELGLESIKYEFDIPDIIQQNFFEAEEEAEVEKTLMQLESLATRNSIKDEVVKIKNALGIISNIKSAATAFDYMVQNDNVDIEDILDQKQGIIFEKFRFSCNEAQDCSLFILNQLNSTKSELKNSLEIVLDQLNDNLQIRILSHTLDFDQIEGQIKEFVKYYRSITPDRFYVSKRVQDVRGDELKIKYSLKPKEGLTITPIYPEQTDSISFNVRSNFKISFSSGIFLSGLSDYEYTTQAFTDGNNNVLNQIALKNDNDTDINLGGLIHVHSDNGGFINPTLSVGAMINDNENIRYLVGGGLIFGRQQRLILNGGLAFGKVERLASNQSIGDQVASFDEVQIVKQSKSSFFIGFSYNF
ncbi:hypothetical protein BFP71_13095 [Roseivirga misakiensis]|uniref:Uncharacterized protein n=2 Tax=Roseivirga misakiensis TaxID=1563681 RepID=A0A1E5SZ66_9BACT|nr:hypothetical protein BFP71_13095 [Roseivirga misakiensis]